MYRTSVITVFVACLLVAVFPPTSFSQDDRLFEKRDRQHPKRKRDKKGPKQGKGKKGQKKYTIEQAVDAYNLTASIAVLSLVDNCLFNHP